MTAGYKKKLGIELISKYKNDKAIFFIDDTLLVDTSHEFLLHLEETLRILNAEILSAIVINSTIVIRLQTQFPKEHLSNLGFHLILVKPFLSTLDTKFQNIILKAYHWLQWDKRSKYCGKCSHILESAFESLEKKCSFCGECFFPRFSPAVIIGIRNDAKILLARSPHFPPDVYSAIAGFIEIGESAEMTIHREVKEEIGIEVTNITYVGSQPWPFPDSFMLAFTADYLRGEIKIDKKEIEDARWFTIENLPKLPEKPSIARKLLDDIIAQGD